MELSLGHLGELVFHASSNAVIGY